jgi:hypothetical protein
MKDRTRLIMWDSALLIGITLFFFWDIQEHAKLIVGFMTVLMMSTCLRNHIAVYKLTGKIY